jgi:hypothetical protein
VGGDDARVDPGVHPVNNAEEGSIGHIRIEHENAVVADFDLPLGKISLGRSPTTTSGGEPLRQPQSLPVVTTAHYSVIEDLQGQNGLSVGSMRVSVHRLQHVTGADGRTHPGVSRLPLRGGPIRASFPCVWARRRGLDTGQTGLIASVPDAQATAQPTKSRRRLCPSEAPCRTHPKGVIVPAGTYK